MSTTSELQLPAVNPPATTALLAQDLGEVAARPVYQLAKRALDAAVSFVALLVLAPLMGILALLIKLQDGGPVVFAQDRIGRGGRRFRFFKFRSMCGDAEAQREQLVGGRPPRFKLEDDPRITPLGRFLRRWSLDELPQFWNVLRGDMSLVGPRPLLPEEVAVHGPRARARLSVDQGLTCFWQVSGRSLLSFERQVELDLSYVRERGLLLDLWLIACTMPAVISGRGAY